MVFLDLDGTLIDAPSAEGRFAACLFRHGLLGLEQLRAAMDFQWRWRGELGKLTLRKNKAYLSGLDTRMIESLAIEFVAAELARAVRPGIARRIDGHMRAAERVVLLTGTPDFIAAPLAKLLGIHGWLATRVSAHRSRFTAAPPLSHPFAEGKLLAANDLCRKVGTSLDRCVAYADSRHDLPLLRGVGRPIAVKPDRHLARAAQAAGWEIIH